MIFCASAIFVEKDLSLRQLL